MFIKQILSICFSCKPVPGNHTSAFCIPGFTYSRYFIGYFFNKSFTALALTFKSLHHFKPLKIFKKFYKVGVQLHLFADIYLSQQHYLKYYFPTLLNCLGTPVGNKLNINIKVHFCTLSSFPLVCMSSLMPVPQFLDY